jgi:hypothetical protein
MALNLRLKILDSQSHFCSTCTSQLIDVRYDLPYSGGLNALPDEAAAALFLLSTGEQRKGQVAISVYREAGRTHRIPQMSAVLGDYIFDIRAHYGVSGPSSPLQRPYQIFFQLAHPTHPQNLNQAVVRLTGGHSRYPWYGDIVILKFLGNRMESYVSNETWDNDLANIQYFFMHQLIESQEGYPGNPI